APGHRSAHAPVVCRVHRVDVPAAPVGHRAVASAGGTRAFTSVLPGGWLAAAALALLLASSQLAVSIVNWLVTLLSSPKLLPRMDFSFGIPRSSRTLVVVPTMLGSERGVDDLVEALEVRFLAN